MLRKRSGRSKKKRYAEKICSGNDQVDRRKKRLADLVEKDK